MPRSRTRTSSCAIPAPPRSKAGCWTCRIRRKRCDEQQDESGACQACVRLDIDCLGWGTRRPDWCRDKDKLAEYKLRLKRKLCTRAGTRPSAARHAQPTQMASTSTTEPAEERDQVESQVDEDEKDTGKCDHSRSVRLSDLFCARPGFELFDNPECWQFSPEFTLPTSTCNLQATYSKSALASLVPHLYSLTQPVPSAYRTLLHQILDLHQYKSSVCAAPETVASRARAVEEALELLARRAHFNTAFTSLTGFEFDPTAFLFDSHQSPQTATMAGMFSPSTPFSPLSDNSYGLLSPATTMWSPDLVPDTLSSAPTSPAVPGLTPIIPTSNLLSNVNDWFAGYDHFQSPTYMAPTPSTPAQQHASLDMLGLRLGLDGLELGIDGANHGASEEYLIFQNDHLAHPQISLFPPSPSQSKSLPSPAAASSSSMPSPPPVHQPYSSPRSETENADPFGIHHKTCLLLLHTLVLGSPIHETERLLQDLTAQFSGLTTLAGCVEYAFAALLAGALSTSADRRALFRDVVNSIESTTTMTINVKATGLAMGQCESLLCEAWNAC
ncbi:SubName: Full=Uncharacterized protein {ECO:0000313/EMBL:CCA66428.1} [Serendipita indica DSM 11827]|nr:SubName: Full=Uncharacterized protein {ECO:0000313/EMBL:CCA66428.1} [Serendipita indica DSM 11827]